MVFWDAVAVLARNADISNWCDEWLVPLGLKMGVIGDDPNLMTFQTRIKGNEMEFTWPKCFVRNKRRGLD